jgi:hypothetical protein
MRDNHARLFEPPFLRAGVPNPRYLSTSAYLALARAAAQRGARRNGLPSALLEGSPAGGRHAARVVVSFPGEGFAPTRVAVAIRGGGDVRLAGGRRPDRIDIEARATAELIPAGDLELTGLADGGGYNGPLAYREGSRCARTLPSHSTAWPPPPAARPASTCRLRAGTAPTPSRPYCGPRTPTRSGSPRRAPASIATAPSSISARRTPTPGWPRTASASDSFAGTSMSPGTTGCR